MRREGILVVRRVDWENEVSEELRNRAWTLSKPFALDRVYSDYRGLDGDLWPDGTNWSAIRMVEGHASLSELASILILLQEQKKKDRTDLLLVAWGEAAPLNIPDEFSFCGYDLAMPVNEYSSVGYSAIYQDVLRGRVAELASFSGRLNEDLLFANVADVDEFRQARLRLLKCGADLENVDDDETSSTVAVWRHS